ncbi:MAG TPA: carboxypeptidase-like regulatory domain-containing protein, partial [Pyrinomonadaceae bacterium]|nr:carboxypeptidase-like regulatory domain-containing protein [Pyrinomonadaceae bacterium]
MKLKPLSLLLTGLLTLFAAPVFAQSPNTATMIVIVTDQAGAVVNDAKVTVVNNDTGASREATSRSDGTATFSGLSLTGTYKVTVAGQGFANEERNNLTLLSGETAT